MFGEIAVDQRGSAEGFAAAGFGVDVDFESFGQDDQGLLGEAAALFFGQVGEAAVNVLRDVADLKRGHAFIMMHFAAQCSHDAGGVEESS